MVVSVKYIISIKFEILVQRPFNVVTVYELEKLLVEASDIGNFDPEPK